VAERQVTYNNIGSGPYRFRVIASNSEGLWNSAESDVSFKIAPAILANLVVPAFWSGRLRLAILLFVRLR